jgi:uncharacterized membrane protein YeiH
MSWSLGLDLLGTFFFAISGCLLAARRGFDIIGSLLLGAFTGVGGGIIRDLILGVTPTAFANPIYVVPPVMAAALVFFLPRRVARLSRPLLLFDAGGLALFCVTGAVKALDHGMNPVAAALLGALTACGGGLLRDVVANRDPQLFNPRDLYAVPALLGAAAVVVVWSFGGYSPVTESAVVIGVFAFRLLSLRFGWHVPLASGLRGSRPEE